MESVLCKYITELDSISRRIINHYPGHRVFGFYGKMGAGKTTFIKSMCRVLGVMDVVNSPTFSIINEYMTAKGESIYHFDLYRLKSANELMDLGYEDYLFSGSYCMIEWPEKFEELLPENFVYIKIEVDQTDQSRMITY
ncbi:MAG: tRNA (adenosine(37)-N6)-threonylcarbamoyltransferase complex ATPase subunit type 1 TsaE [Bacteroidetes bacterium]|nr:tRNA (adenosine(37)-N6)-threonylcarbamoyltransferase complex ATPase subunit type 1 TsaE [Bacteroidota bacterium]